MASESKKKRPTSIIPGDESRRRREGTAGRRIAPLLPIILWLSNTVTLSSSFLKQIMERAALRSAATRV